MTQGGATAAPQRSALLYALTFLNLRNVVEVFAMADKLGLSLAGLREAFA